jgi:hypothetical protein
VYVTGVTTTAPKLDYCVATTAAGVLPVEIDPDLESVLDEVMVNIEIVLSPELVTNT